MNHIKNLWDGFRDDVLPEDISPMQLVQLRRVFYTGAAEVFEAIMQRLENPNTSQEEGSRFLSELDKEVVQFMHDLTDHRV